jgi:hypothetical protein
MDTNEFSRMILPVYDIEHGSDLRLRFMPTIDKYFPSFQNFEKETKLPIEHVNRVIRYIVYMYDKNSPMIHKHPDYSQRMFECAALAGFDMKKSTEKFLDTIYRQNDPAMANMAFEYIRHQKAPEWAQLCANEKMFYDNIKDIMAVGKIYRDEKQKLDGQVVKAKMREENAKILTDNVSLYDRVFKELAVKEIAKAKATTAESRSRMNR